MPNENASITMYEISKCGYFSGRNKSPDFGGLTETLNDLKDWASAKTLEDTFTYEPTEDLLPTYLYNIKEYKSTWLLTIWNRTPTTQGKVASVMGNSKVGNAKVVMNGVQKGSIPGFATYFWIIPSRNIFANIRFQHAISGQPAFQQYVQSFLESCSSHVAFDPNPSNADIEILGYREDPQDSPGNFSPRFHTNLFRKVGPHAYLASNADKIQRVIKKTKLALNQAQDLADWQRLLRWSYINPNSKNKPADFINMSYTVGVNLTRADVLEIIKEWSENDDRQWDDFGFKLKGDPKTHWLSHAIARNNFDLEVKRENDEVVDTDSLLQALYRARSKIMGLLQ